jgi:hypothetical protein
MLRANALKIILMNLRPCKYKGVNITCVNSTSKLQSLMSFLVLHVNL